MPNPSLFSLFTRKVLETQGDRKESGVLMNLSTAASMPSRQQRPAVAALVDDILQ